MDGPADEKSAPEESLLRWWTEHSELDRLVEGVVRTLATGNGDEVARALEDFEDTLEGHFTVEEKVYFPLVQKYSPRHEPVVRASLMGHQHVREALNDLRELVEQRDFASARRSLSVLLDRFKAHEKEEGKLILDLENIAEATPK